MPLMRPDAVERLNATLEGRYRIERELGEGGMATVYLAEDLKHKRKVALKVLKPELAAVVGAERFLAEIETTANLTHPHILPLHDSGEADGFLFFVMPYIEGDTLRDRIDREKQLSVDDALDITKKVASALDYAHEHGVVHRDIKPGNILLSGRGEPTVADFGIALAVAQAGGGRVTETGLSVGTPHYMSPEQASGDRDVDPRTDVYALGCVLYEMLTGEPPYPGATAQAVLAKILTDEAPAASKIRRTIPPNVDAAIRKALEKLPADRFLSAAEFAEALGNPAFRHGIESRDAGAESTSGDPRRWRRLAVAASASALVLALALAWALARPEPPQPVTRFALTLPDAVEPVTGFGVNLEVAPDGSSVVFTGTSPEGSGSQLWMRPLAELSPRPIPGTEEGRNPRFSPDGRSLAFTSNGRLVQVSLTGSPPLVLVPDSVPDGPGAVAWGSDGMVYFRKEASGIWRVPAGGGDPERITTVGEGEAGHAWVDLLPGARGLLFTRDVGTTTEDEIAVASLESGEVRTLFRGAAARYSETGHIVYTSGDGTLLAVPFDPERMEVFGTPRALLQGVQVNPGSASYFALSRSGVLVYRTMAGNLGGVPVWLERDGTEEVLDPSLTGTFEAPAISPGGRRIAFEHTPSGASTSDIWVYHVDQETFSRLTFDGGEAPFWSPDGGEVGYLSPFSAGDGASNALYARPADLSGPARLLRNSPSDGRAFFEALWAPDGRHVIYRWGPSPNTTDLAYAPPHPDSASTVLLDTPFSVRGPSLSPDGRWLAYESDESGVPEVYVRPFPGPGGQVRISASGGINPVWARSGDEIFYRSQRDPSLWVARVRTDPDFGVESREPGPWAQGLLIGALTQQIDVAPDDERLLGIRFGVGVGNAQSQYIVVENFFEELREGSREE